MTNNIPVDIVMGTYNGAEFLQEQIASLRSQTYHHWRLLVRDDGSSDNTVDLLKAASEKDARIHVVSDDPSNLGFNWNFLHLLGLTSAPYAMFCDQDDVWLPRKVELTLREMLRVQGRNPSQPTLVHCDAVVADARLAVLHDRFIGARGRRPGLSAMLFANCVQGATSMINASLRERALRMQPLLPYDYHCGLIAQALGQRHFLDQALMLYRQHSRNAIGTGAGRKLEAAGRVSPTLQLAIHASSPVRQTIGFFADELSPATVKEMDDFAEVVSGKNRLKRMLIAVRRRYAFARRRDRINLLLYICNMRNI
jgi:rhamnosyltransferase